MRKEAGTEILYHCDTARSRVVKTSLKGEVLWTHDYPNEVPAYAGAPINFVPTNVAFAPNGDFFVGDGIHNNVLKPGEMVTRVRVPAASRGARQAYGKLRPRGAIDFPMLSVAVAGRVEGGMVASLRIVVSALGARPRTLGGLDALVAGRSPDESLFEAVAAAAHKQCKPLTNVPYDDAWRHDMVPVFVKRALREAFAGSAS